MTFGLGVSLYAQDDPSSVSQEPVKGYNPNSVRPIYEDNIMYRTTVWRRINLLEKQNKPFFSYQNEITQVIIDAVKERKIQPYYVSSSPRETGFEQPMVVDDFIRNLKYYDASFDDSIDIRASELYILEIKEDLIFDRRRSRMYWDIQSITLTIPQGTNPETEMGDIPFATFKFKDLYDYFREVYEETKAENGGRATRAFWYNPQNNQMHLCLADAFDLRLFSSRIFKVANPDDKDIVDIINDEYQDDPSAAKKVLYMSQKIEYDLMEFEHNLWEF